ncbi:tetratricopeptide repeat protein [Longimicrobium sp.]|uniref:tetratricopeptide repeat protein n=1 Tax=Longimicrobium sp. TaxID=2029185 RepID=UPI003B3AA56A
MPTKLLVLLALLLLSSRPAGAQWYDPASGQSPMVLMAGPADGVAYYEMKERARVLNQERKFAEALPLLEQLVRDYPRDPENWTLLGRARYWLGKHREAADAWGQAGPLIGWDLQYANGYRVAFALGSAGDRRAALDTLRHMIFQRHGYFRRSLESWPEFAMLKEDPEFQEIIGKVNTTGWTRDQGWAYDVEFLYNEMKRVNPDYRDRPLPEEVTRRYEALKRDIPRLSDEEIFIGMERMLAPLRQGHVSIWNPPGNRYLPARLYAFPEGLFIIESPDPQLVGARIVAFGDTPAEEAMRLSAGRASVDGDMQYLWGVSGLAETASLKGLGIIDRVDSVPLTLQFRDGRTRTVRVATLATEPEGRQDRLVAPPGVAPPLFLRDIVVTQKHWETPLPQHDALYVQVNNLVDEQNETLARFGQRLWAVLDSVQPANLILDLRHNNGGTTQLYPELLRTLVAFSRPAGRQVYVLIGRRSFSATGNFVTDLERLVDPIFVGEASSECCNLYGDPTTLTLPYSGTQGEMTAVKWQLSTPSDRRREMSPEVPVQLTAAAYFAGQDPAMDAIFRMIASRRSASR